MALALNVLVAKTSTPASKYWRWIASITVGFVIFNKSLLPLRIPGDEIKCVPL